MTYVRYLSEMRLYNPYNLWVYLISLINSVLLESEQYIIPLGWNS